MSLQPRPVERSLANRREASSLARLQQGLVLTAVALIMLWGWWAQPGTSWSSAAILALIVMGYAVVLALEFLAAAMINRTDDTSRATCVQWLGAWWQEVRIAPNVFGWRQPFRWRCLPDTSAPLQASLPGVVLVHGFLCNRGFWLPWMKRLRALDVPYVSVNLEPIFGSIDAYVQGIEAAVIAVTALTGRPPTIICHSMGGLATRAWLAASPDAVKRVHRIITIGTPHRGTSLARFSRLQNGRQMRRGCDWQTDLMKREQALDPHRNADRFVCWYSNTDNIVFPASTATFPGADNRLVVGAAHVALAFHSRVMEESLTMLTSDGRSPSERTAE